MSSKRLRSAMATALGLGLLVTFGCIFDPTAKQAPEAPEPWNYEVTVFAGDADLSRPELCILNDRVYVTFRRAAPASRSRMPELQIVLKVFDISPIGDWTDRTAELFGDEFHVLYGPDDPQNAGEFRDHQLVCSADAFWLAFSTGFQKDGQEWMHIVVRRYDSQWTLGGQTAVLDTPKGPGVQNYKSDDNGAAWLDDVLYVWVVTLANGLGTPATGFALYGLDPSTLDIVVDDGAGGPVILKNPLQSPFAGVMDFVDGEYRLLTNPHDPSGKVYDQDGLVSYRYDGTWHFLGQDAPEHPFGDDRPAYFTGRTRYGEAGRFEAWGFTLTPPDAGQDKGAIGEAWLRLGGPEGAVYLQVSARDDTRHTEIAIHDDKAYVGYFHVTEPRAVTIRRYAIPSAP